MEDYRQQLVDGEWVTGSGDEYQSINPYTGEAWAVFSEASEGDVDRAVRSATDAFEVWRRTPGRVRGELLTKLADLIIRDLDRLAEIETRDNGKLLRENKNQITFVARNLRFMAGLADKITGESKPLDTLDIIDYTEREPLGVCAGICAWNSPLSNVSNKLGPALAAGNTMVLKPSEYTSASALELGRLVCEAGFPPGVVNVVTGAGATGQALTSHPGVAKISFTGGVETARRIAENGAQNIVPALFELGGKSANIIFSDADMDLAIPGAVSGIFAAAGQTCVAGSRLLVQDEVYDDVVNAVVERTKAIKLGDPMDPATHVGPLAFAAHNTRVKAAIASAHEDGARLVAGGGAPEGMEDTLFVQPTIFADVTPKMRLAQQEVFGPVLAIMRFTSEEEAITIANGTNFGLVAGLWTTNLTRAHRVSRELRAGTIYINMYRAISAQAPAGGIKHSGYGRERGTEVLHEYTTTKNTMINLSEVPRDPFLLGT
ncbi:aldehyde dehydrogenase [Gordonia sp. LSe1-13]|uniref:Aldehyde dehydrogenase n=1 Tax=Gordonia sesuvii TaxID=3116777 RepID=A0ABU7MKA1_9ACTN|nr:aldehyde dehydrogenase [Gordonia sp. LSe1-13]